MKVGSIFKALTLSYLFVLSSDFVTAQTFEEWKRSQKEEFQAYKDEFDEEFIKMLKNTWEEIGITKGSEKKKKKKPIDIPVFIPPKPNVKNENPKNVSIEERITIDLDIEIDKNPLSLPPPTADRNKQSNK